MVQKQLQYSMEHFACLFQVGITCFALAYCRIVFMKSVHKAFAHHAISYRRVS